MLLAALIPFIAVSCSDNGANVDDDDDNEFVELIGDLPTQTLTADKKYLMKG